MILSDVVSEKAVLAGIYKGGLKSFIEIDTIINSPKIFTVNNNQILFSCFRKAFQAGIEELDIACIFSSAQDLGLNTILADNNVKQHIEQIINFGVNVNNLKKYAQKIRKLSITRNLIRELDQSRTLLTEVTGDEKIGEILSIVEAPLTNFSQNVIDNDDPINLGAAAKKYLEDKQKNPTEQVGLSSGFPIWDFLIGGGLRSGTINMIGARMKHFKSGFCLNVAMQLAFNLDIPVLYIDTELDETEQIPRMMANLSKISISNIETGQFTKTNYEQKKLFEHADRISDTNLWHKNVVGYSFDEQIAYMKKWLYKVPGIKPTGEANECLIIYDYIKLTDPKSMGSMKEYEAIGYLLSSLHNFAKTYKIPALVPTQLNRDGISKETTDVISQSDRIGWFCSNFSIFKEKSGDEIEWELKRNIINAGNYKLIPIICRHGRGINEGDYINYQVTGDYFEIKEKELFSKVAKNKLEIDDE